MPAAGCANRVSLRTLREAAEASTDNSLQRTGSPTYKKMAKVLMEILIFHS